MSRGDKDDPIKVTDKQATKLLQCSYPGCEKWLECSKFESEDRARCPEHKGKNAPSYRTEMSADPEPEELDGSLGDLECPFCDGEPLVIVRVDDQADTIALKCRNCKVLVEITPRFGPLLIPEVPEDLRPLVRKFNEERGGAVRGDGSF